MKTPHTQALGTHNRALVHLSWQQIWQTVEDIARRADHDGAPQTLVAVLRGGAIPAVWLAHRLQLRDVRAIDVTRTTGEGPHAAKTSQPQTANPDSLGDLSGQDVLVVDDVAGTGHTLDLAARMSAQAGARRVRTAVCAVNSDNWSGPEPAPEVITFIGAIIRGWAVFPWEGTDGY